MTRNSGNGDDTLQVLDSCVPAEWVEAQVHERLGLSEVDDDIARSIASQWQSPERPALTRLAAGQPAIRQEILTELAAAMDAWLDAGAHDEEGRCIQQLLALGTWTANHA